MVLPAKVVVDEVTWGPEQGLNLLTTSFVEVAGCLLVVCFVELAIWLSNNWVLWLKSRMR